MTSSGLRAYSLGASTIFCEGRFKLGRTRSRRSQENSLRRDLNLPLWGWRHYPVHQFDQVIRGYGLAAFEYCFHWGSLNFLSEL